MPCAVDLRERERKRERRHRQSNEQRGGERERQMMPGKSGERVRSGVSTQISHFIMMGRTFALKTNAFMAMKRIQLTTGREREREKGRKSEVHLTSTVAKLTEMQFSM